MAYKLPKNITRRTRRTRKNSGTGFNKVGVCAHWWDEPERNPTFNGTVEWLARDSVQASVQCVAEHNKITYMEKDSSAAWHAGHYEANRDLWAIEINPRLSDGDYLTAAEAIAKFWFDRCGGNPTVIEPHHKFTSTNCPGSLDIPKLRRYAVEALNKQLGKRKPKKVKRVKLDVDGIMGPQTISELQRVIGTDIDGFAGVLTWQALQARVNTPVDGVVSSQYWHSTDVGRNINAAQWEHVGRNAVGSRMVMALQRNIGAKVDGIWYKATTRALQVALNKRKL